MTEAVPLFGHEEAVAAFRAELDSGRLHHAWLIAGPPGVGKRSFAQAGALRWLAGGSGRSSTLPGLGVEADRADARMFRAGSHPDFRFIEREAWEKNKKPPVIIPKQDRGPADAIGRNIRVAQIRWMTSWLGQTGALSSHRAAIIDAADDLEKEAANALLKTLEEPPAGAILFLISHSPDRLLPTIRSRCRMLRLSSLPEAAMESALNHLLPEAGETERAMLVQAGRGAPGAALAMSGLDIAGLDKAMLEILRWGDPDNRRRIALAKSLALKAAHPRYEAFLARYPLIVAAEARDRKGPALARVLAVWERGSEISARARAVSLDPQTTVFELAGMLASLAPGFQERTSRT